MASHISVAHRWAQMNRNLSVKGFNMFAEGFSIFSYGRHFEIARWVPTTPAKDAQNVDAMCVLFNSESRSISTSKHQTYVLRSIRSSARVFHLPEVFWPTAGGGNAPEADKRKRNAHTVKEGLKYYEAKALDLYAKASRARTWADSYIEQAERTLAEAEDFARYFGVKYERPNVDGLKAKAAKQAEATAKAAQKARKAALAAQKVHDAEQAAMRALWVAGASAQAIRAQYPNGHLGYFNAPDGSAYVRRNGDNLETSQGVAVPWAHAVKVFQFVKLVRERGVDWHTNGKVIRVGHYNVDLIDGDGNMTAGCHRFKWETMEALAIKEDVAGFAASEDVVEVRA